jgi:class 3 adenylate cyclase
VNIAARVQALANAAEICISDEVRSFPGVLDLLAPYAQEASMVEFRGVGRPLPVLRIGAATDTAQ